MSPKLKVFINFLWKKRTLYVLLGMLIAIGMFVLILATTLNVYLPGYLDVEKRALVMESAMRIDSLERENNLRMAYLNNMLDILHDRVKKTDKLLSYDSTVVIIQDTLLTASERERAFVARYEEQERFGLNALDRLNPGTPNMVFIAPVRGKIIAYEADDKSPTETRIELDGNVNVLSPTEGTVISIAFIMGQGYHLVLQHQQDYVTIYTNLTSVSVDINQTVKSGQVLGRAGNSKDPSDSWMGLSLWHKGKSIEPETIMPIE